MRIIHQNGFDDYERKVWKNVVFRNLTDAFLDIFEIMEEQRTELQYPSNTVSPNLSRTDLSTDFNNRNSMSSFYRNARFVLMNQYQKNTLIAFQIYGQILAFNLECSKVMSVHYMTTLSSESIIPNLAASYTETRDVVSWKTSIAYLDPLIYRLTKIFYAQGKEQRASARVYLIWETIYIAWSMWEDNVPSVRSGFTLSTMSVLSYSSPQ